MSKQSQGASPLFVDLDGTVVKTDLLFETFVSRLKRDPLALFRAVTWLMRGRSHLKARLAEGYRAPLSTLPYNEALCSFLLQEAAQGREIYLATASDRRVAEQIAHHLGVFRGVVASDGDRNLKGRHKLEALRKHHSGDFEYAGNGAEDLPIWREAKGAIVVGASPRVERLAKAGGNVTKVFSREGHALRDYLRAMRPYQWLKNLLIFVPLLTAHAFEKPEAILSALLTFAAFSLAASTTYIVNDILDLDSDRAHPKKRNRPFAAGAVPIAHGLALAAVLLVAGALLAWVVSPKVFGLTLLYVTLTSAYSWVLKSYVLIDVVTLAALYTLRIVTGTVAIEESTSFWLLAFSAFLFLSLALVKRCAELVPLGIRSETSAKGRDYQVGDLPILQALGVASGVAALVVFALYINDPDVMRRYASPQLLWIGSLGLVYWIGRMWIKTSRGEMHDDPLVFALKDRGSRFVLLGMVLTTLAAYGLGPGLF